MSKLASSASDVDRHPGLSPAGLPESASWGARHERARLAEDQLFAALRLSAETRFISVADAELAMRFRVLEAGAGDPVLMIHGGGGFAALWAPLMAQMPGVRSIAIDRPGCGLSDGFDYRGVAFREHAVSFIGAALDALGLDRVPIAANSMGALWSFWFALAHPHRVASLSLLGCPAFIPGTALPLAFRLLGVRGLNRLMLAAEPASDRQVKKTWKRMGHEPERMLQTLTECFYRMEQLPSYGPGWLSLLERAVTLRGGARPDVRISDEELRRITQPTLLIWGKNDPFGSLEAARHLCGVLPDAALHVVGEGHLPWLDEPKHCAELISRFLREQKVAEPAFRNAAPRA